MFSQNYAERARWYNFVSKLGLLVAGLTFMLWILPGGMYRGSMWFTLQLAAGLLMFSCGGFGALIVEEMYPVQKWHKLVRISMVLTAVFVSLMFTIFLVKFVLTLGLLLVGVAADPMLTTLGVLFCTGTIITFALCCREFWQAYQTYRAAR